MLLGISKTLREYLRSAIPETNVEIGMLGAGLALPPSDTVLVFLYLIEEVRESRRPPTRGGTQAPPTLRLRYLVTCTTANANDLQERLSRVLEVFDDHPVFQGQELDESIADKVESLVVQLRAPAQDELESIWTALGTGMRLSLYYEITAQPSLADAEDRVRGT
jgi:hypothetical protein